VARKYFGTDGIRGRVKLGWAAGRVLGSNDGGDRVIIGKDTRISGYMFESALEAGLSAAGVDVRLLGPMPTPAIAYLTRTLHACAGIVISASHNAYADNGIKFFSSEGAKLGDEVELAIEAELDKPMVTVESRRLGKAERVTDAGGRYIEFCKSTIPLSLNLKGLKIVVDNRSCCARLYSTTRLILVSRWMVMATVSSWLITRATLSTVTSCCLLLPCHVSRKVP